MIRWVAIVGALSAAALGLVGADHLFAALIGAGVALLDYLTGGALLSRLDNSGFFRRSGRLEDDAMAYWIVAVVGGVVFTTVFWLPAFSIGFLVEAFLGRPLL